MESTVTRESIIGTTWTHTFNDHYPQLGIREWYDGAVMVEVYRLDTGEWITRDWPTLALKYITQNWYELDTPNA
jgi:hypothetical protein